MPSPRRSLWRISNHAEPYGRGGLRAGARWRSKGREIVHCAGAPTGAWKRRTLLTRSIGDAWLAAGRTVALRVPSAISPHAFNVLLNPRLPAGSGIRIVAKSRHPFDTRLFKTVAAGRATGRQARR